MKGKIIILILIVCALSGYRIYKHYERKAELEKQNKPKISDFNKDFIEIFKNKDKKLESDPVITGNSTFITPSENTKADKKKFYNNNDIKRLNTIKFKNRNFITEKDIEKYKVQREKEFGEIENKDIKRKNIESPLEKLIKQTKNKIQDDKKEKE